MARQRRPKGLRIAGKGRVAVKMKTKRGTVYREMDYVDYMMDKPKVKKSYKGKR